jgi:hypothetical protein
MKDLDKPRESWRIVKLSRETKRQFGRDGRSQLRIIVRMVQEQQREGVRSGARR